MYVPCQCMAMVGSGCVDWENQLDFCGTLPLPGLQAVLWNVRYISIFFSFKSFFPSLVPFNFNILCSW